MLRVTSHEDLGDLVEATTRMMQLSHRMGCFCR